MSLTIFKVIIGVLLVSHAAFTFRIQPKIRNGIASSPNQFPHYVYLDTSEASDTSEKAFCGASLISDRWIVTAAHCLIDNVDIDVFLGMSTNGTYADRIRVEVSNQFMHPQYDDDTLKNDIALLELLEPIKSNPHVQPIKLPTDCGELLENEKVTTVGRGPSSLDTNDNDKTLRYAEMLTLSSVACFTKIKRPNFESKSVICAESATPEQFLLGGDSGGPLIRGSDNTLIGITSFSQYYIDWLKGQQGANQVFTSIHYHFDWISQKTGLQLPLCQ